MRVVVTREKGYNDRLVSWLPEGAEVIDVPLTTTRYRDDVEVQSALRASVHYGAFRTLVVTSARSALYVALAREGLAPGGSVVSVGPATARSLESEDMVVDVIGRGRALDLDSSITDGPVLILGAASMRDELKAALTHRSLAVEALTCYETVPTTLTCDDESHLRDADVVFVGAPSAWLVAKEFIGVRTWVVVPGATTAAAVRRDHQRVIEGWGHELRERLLAL